MNNDLCTIIAPVYDDIDHSADLINRFVRGQAKIEWIRILQNVKSLLCIKEDTLPRPIIVF